MYSYEQTANALCSAAFVGEIITSIFLALFSLSSYLLISYAFIFTMQSKSAAAQQARQADLVRRTQLISRRWPSVTVQLAIYNERFVVERLLDAVYALDYPADLCQIQILDDSSDDTGAIIDAFIRRNAHRCRFDVRLCRRRERTGYKAGALKAATDSATGDFLALFDADFVPPPTFLKDVLPHFDDGVACVQTRWGHCNENDSLLCRLQAIGHDGHFIVEQYARAQGGLLLNFNGTGGIWRKDALVRAGGWSSDTLAEDLDLSYRVQFLGYKIKYLRDVVVPAEIPLTISAFKKQQTRWAKGSLQAAAKNMRTLLLHEKLSWLQKFTGAMHLLGYLAHLFLLTMITIKMVTPLLDCERINPLLVLPKFSLAIFLGPPLVCFVARAYRHVSPVQCLLEVVEVMVLFQGLCINNARAALWVIFSWKNNHDGGDFERTPKFGRRSLAGVLEVSNEDNIITNGNNNGSSNGNGNGNGSSNGNGNQQTGGGYRRPTYLEKSGSRSNSPSSRKLNGMRRSSNNFNNNNNNNHNNNNGSSSSDAGGSPTGSPESSAKSINSNTIKFDDHASNTKGSGSAYITKDAAATYRAVIDCNVEIVVVLFLICEIFYFSVINFTAYDKVFWLSTYLLSFGFVLYFHWEEYMIIRSGAHQKL